MVKDIKTGYYCEDENYKLYGPFKTVKDCEAYDKLNDKKSSESRNCIKILLLLLLLLENLTL